MMDARALARLYGLSLGVLLVLKLGLAAIAPMSGDEAYFLLWGRQPDWGFYDHPPMVGWLLWPMLRISGAEWVLRLPAVLSPILVSLAMVWVMRPMDEARAWLAGLLFLWQPLSALDVLVTTDTPLLLFSFLSLAFLWRGERTGRWRDYVLAGIFLGLALSSKYFAALLAAAYVVYGAAFSRRRSAMLLVFVAAAPFVALHLWWNAGHCWANVMFNFFNRHGDAGFRPSRPLLYVASLFYWMTPWLAWEAWRHRQALVATARAFPGRLLAVAFTLPMLVFALLSLVKTIGLHWPMSFYPFFFMLVALALPAERAFAALRLTAGFTALHLLAIAVFAALPLAMFKGWSKYDGMVFMLRPAAVLAALEPYSDHVWATDGYSSAALAAYAAKRPVVVFGEGSGHARHDDILTDFRKLDGRDFAILLKHEPEFARFAPYFQALRFMSFEVEGARYWLVLGHRFDFQRYREVVLRRVKEEYYAVPGWLPMTGCYFCERYFPGEACRRP